MTCFVIDALRRVFVLSTVSFSVDFHIDILDDKIRIRFDKSSDQIMFINMIWIIEYVIFAINFDIASSSKIFNTFLFCLSIHCNANINQ